MENVICTILEDNSSKDFISSLNKFGDCIDYSNDYERSNTLKGIFAGVINKVEKPVIKGKGGHLKHDVVFVSATSLINSRRESQPFRIGFVGAVVNQLVKANLKEGDAIGVLKPSFFYVLDIPSLCAGTTNVVVWIGKNFKDSQTSLESSRLSGENHNKITTQRKLTKKMVRKRRLYLEDSSDVESSAESSTLSSVMLKQDIQVYRSKPVDLNEINNHKHSVNKPDPDSTSKLVTNKNQNSFNRNKNVREIELVENVFSQNTVNVGSYEGSVQIENGQSQFHNNCNSISGCANRVSCCSCTNNMRCNKNSHINVCKHKCPCDSHKIPETLPHCLLGNHCCNLRKNCECFGNQRQCLCRSNLCCRNHLKLSSCWNDGHSCYTSKSAHECCHHNCGVEKQLSFHSHNTGYCNQNCHLEAQNNCSRLKIYPRTTYCNHGSCSVSRNCSNEYVLCNHPSNSCHSHHEHLCRQDKGKSHGPEDNNPCLQYEVIDDASVAISEDSGRNNRTKEWVKNWVGNPPCIQALPTQKSQSECCSDQNICNEKHVNKTKPNSSDINTENSKNSDMPCGTYSRNPAKEFEKKNVKKKKLFCPLDNSTIISEKTIYNNSTIIEESTPFSSENPTQNTENTGYPTQNSTDNTGYPTQNTENTIKNPENTGYPTQNSSENTGNSTPNDNVDSEENQSSSNLKSFELPLSNSAKEVLDDSLNDTMKKNNICSSVKEDSSLTAQPNETGMMNYLEKNVKESLAHIDLPGKESEHGLRENNKSSEEQFPELRIDTPLVTPETDDGGHENTENCEAKASIQKESNKSFNNENHEFMKSNIENNSDINSKEETNVQETTAENLNNTVSNLVVNLNTDVQSVIEFTKEDEGKNNFGDGVPSFKKAEKSNSNISLSLSDYSRSKTVCHDNNEVEDMELTLVNKKCNEKKRQPEESQEDLMEFTCESKLMKRRKGYISKEASEKCAAPDPYNPVESNNTVIRDHSVSSSGTYFDAQSRGSTPESFNRWCLKSYDEAYENEKFEPESLKALGLTPFTSYSLKINTTFSVVGIIVGVVPKLSSDNFGCLVKGFCNQECIKEYSYEEYKEMEEVENSSCSACRQRFHVACPQCFRRGLTYPLCMYYNFEIHLFDGKNVLRIEVINRNGITFLGCTPQLYLRNEKLFLKLNRILGCSSPTKWADAPLLKAKVKVISNKGTPVFNLMETSLKKDIVWWKK